MSFYIDDIFNKNKSEYYNSDINIGHELWQEFLTFNNN